jgi:hypothetical protein
VVWCWTQGRPQEIIQGGGGGKVISTDHMLAMEACKISDGGQLNSGTAEPFLD